MKKLRIKRFNLYIFLLLLPLLETPYISNNLSTLHQVIVLLKYSSIVIIFFLYLINNVEGKISVPAFFIITFSLASIFSTLLNGGEIRTVIIESLQLSAIVLVGDMLAKRSLQDFISVVYPVFFLLILINFITMVVFPNGMYRKVMEGSYVWISNNNWFLGLENGMTAYLVPTLALSYINMVHKRTRLSYILAIFVTVICLYTPIVRHKGSMLVCILLIVILASLSYFKILPDFINAKTYLVFNVIFFFILIGLNSVSSYIINYAELLLNRETLTIRKIIWDKTIDLIKEKPIIGYGYELAYVVSSKLKYDSSHNEYLWILYRGGILQFLSFMYFVISSTKNLLKKNDYLVVKIAAASFFVLLLMWQTESIINNALMLYFTFVYYCGLKGDELFLR